MAAPSFKTYVISLRDNEKRRATMTAKLNALNIPFEFFDAVDGRQFDVTTHPNYDRKKRLMFFGRDLKGGEIGCLLSHKKILEMVADPHHGPALILEDDAVLNPDIGTVINGLLTCGYPWDVVRFLGSKKVSKLRQRIVHHINDTYNLTRLSTSPGGTHAYLVRSNGAKKLVSHLERSAFPVDAIMGRAWQTGVDVFTVQPGLATQDLELESAIGDDRMDKTIQLNGMARVIFPFTRGFYKASDTIMKRVVYWGSWPKDRIKTALKN